MIADQDHVGPIGQTERLHAGNEPGNLCVDIERGSTRAGRVGPIARSFKDQNITISTGTRLILDGAQPDGGEGEASVALILWSDGNEGRPLVAEFSFRLEDEKERFSRGLSRSARSFFEGVQRLERARPEGRTKTEFIYRDADGD